ncbi:bi-domain-containing oxidoreductase [Crateriforma spongiae]|uniref:bi-domain-containing oxidoreductase n=1 Tax=Crateriforma spongiae TaxID=2724528 RepID=UPI0039AF48F6
MKQILQNLGNGETMLAEAPAARRGSGALRCDSTVSLVSLGTERMLIDFGKGGLIAKARSQPDKVKQVLEKIKTDGLWTTIDAVKAKLDTPIPLGYCNVGRVTECDPGCGFAIGDRVASNGPHAEQVVVPRNLCAKIPDAVSDDAAAFTVVGAIGLQGIRLIQPTLGEKVVVSGLGLIGLIAVQMLRANGCQVLGIDFDPTKLKLAQQFGAHVCDLSLGQDPVAVAEAWTDGVGVDAVLITASTKSDELIHQAATMCRQRGRIVLVGVIGLNLQRADFYEKELSFQVSCSYGPGRYDDNYEKRGLDYPIGFVRWTEKRNFEAVLQLMAEGKIDVDPLITHRFEFDQALKGYEAIHQPGAMGILLEYGKEGGQVTEAGGQVTGEGAAEEGIARGEVVGDEPSPALRGRLSQRESEVEMSGGQVSGTGKREEGIARGKVVGDELSPALGDRLSQRVSGDGDVERQLPGLGRDVGIAFVGAGGFSTRMLMPLLPSKGVTKQSVVSGSGVSATYAKDKFGFTRTESDLQKVLTDPKVDAVFITTPHQMHSKMVCDALQAGKHVFVEKPLSLDNEGIDRVQQLSCDHQDQLLMIGFNRRFSPHMVAMKRWMQSTPEPKSIVITVNAGAIPADHWTQDREVGGGRIVGEGCHFIDLAMDLAGNSITSYSVSPMRGHAGRLGDCVAIQLGFADGSIATIHYLANGSKKFPKERVEVFAGGKVYACDNFRRSQVIGDKQHLKTSKQDKGHAAEIQAFFDAIQNGGSWPISLEDQLLVSRVAVDLQDRV